MHNSLDTARSIALMVAIAVFMTIMISCAQHIDTIRILPFKSNIQKNIYIQDKFYNYIYKSIIESMLSYIFTIGYLTLFI